MSVNQYLNQKYCIFTISQKIIAKLDIIQKQKIINHANNGKIFLLLQEYIKYLLNLQENAYGKISCISQS